MEKANSIKKNFIYNAVYQILIIVFPLVTSPYISRVLGVEGLGIYSYRYSVANYFVIFAMLGISTHGNRSIAMVRDDKNKLSQTFSSIFTAHLCISLLVFIIYLVFSIYFVDNNKSIALIEAIYVLSAVFDINWFFFGIERFDLTVTRNILIKVISIICIFTFVKERTDLWKYALIMSLGLLISQSFVWIYLKRYIHWTMPKAKEVLSQVRPMLILFLPVIAISIYKLMDKIMLGAMTSMFEVGIYENGEKINSLTAGIITALGTVMLPRMSNLTAKGEKEESQKYINISIQFVSLLAAAISFGLIGIGNTFAPVFFGEEFQKSGVIIELLAPTILFVAWADVIRMQFLIPNKKDSVYICSMFAGAVVNVILNAIFIPYMGAAGAAIGTIGAEISVFTVQAIGSKKSLPHKKYIGEVLPYVCIGAVMCVLVNIVKTLIHQTTIVSLIIEICTGSIVYIVFVLLYWRYTNNEFGIMVINSIKKLKK